MSNYVCGQTSGLLSQLLNCHSIQFSLSVSIRLALNKLIWWLTGCGMGSQREWPCKLLETMIFPLKNQDADCFGFCSFSWLIPDEGNMRWKCLRTIHNIPFFNMKYHFWIFCSRYHCTIPLQISEKFWLTSWTVTLKIC